MLKISEFQEMIKNIRDTEKIIGNKEIRISKNSYKNLAGRKSIYVIRNIDKNEIFTKQNIGLLDHHLVCIQNF